MFLLAHIGYTFLAAEILAHIYYWIFYKKKELEESASWGLKHFVVIPLAIGAMGPDIIDKFISEPIVGYGRYVGHSLFFAILIFIVAILLFRKNPHIYVSFIIGWIMHILLDSAGFIPWFFPFVNYEFQPKTETYFQMLLEPYVYSNEIAGFLTLIFLLALYLRRGFTLKSLLQHSLSLRLK
ncbi:MAG: metal-dependent hydrolase [Candidatus Heimdallarchaeaceae archaeon]